MLGLSRRSRLVRAKSEGRSLKAKPDLSRRSCEAAKPDPPPTRSNAEGKRRKGAEESSRPPESTTEDTESRGAELDEFAEWGSVDSAIYSFSGREGGLDRGISWHLEPSFVMNEGFPGSPAGPIARAPSHWSSPHRDPFYEGGCQGYSFPCLGVFGPDIRVLHDAQQVDLPGDDDKSFLISKPLLFF